MANDIENIGNLIRVIRGQQVMLDKDLAALYGVETRALNQAVKRNIDRFPEDFMFQLTQEEFENWKSQFVISNHSNSHSLMFFSSTKRLSACKYTTFPRHLQGWQTKTCRKSLELPTILRNFAADKKTIPKQRRNKT